MEIDFEVKFVVGGKTYKEVRENLQKRVDKLLEGTRGAKVEARIRPDIGTTTLGGIGQIHGWLCEVSIYQTVGGSK